MLEKIEAYNYEGQSIGLIPVGTSFKVGGVAIWPGDTNNDCKVDEYDILPIAMYWKMKVSPRRDTSLDWEGISVEVLTDEEMKAVYADTNGDGIIDASDILAIGRNWGKARPMSKLMAKDKSLEIVDIDHSKYLEAYRAMYNLLLASSSESDKYIVLKQTLKNWINQGIRQEIPKTTKLLQNYPNPFNPETCIPFTLSERVHVVIKIYNITGQLIRTLELGMKEAGNYVSPDRAAYWDGRNEEGNEVASGVYFYQIQAGSYVSTKKMVVLK